MKLIPNSSSLLKQLCIWNIVSLLTTMRINCSKVARFDEFPGDFIGSFGCSPFPSKIFLFIVNRGAGRKVMHKPHRYNIEIEFNHPQCCSRQETQRIMYRTCEILASTAITFPQCYQLHTIRTAAVRKPPLLLQESQSIIHFDHFLTSLQFQKFTQ